MEQRETRNMVEGFIMENKAKGARVKCTPPFRKQWEKMGFEVIFTGMIDITEWGKPVSDEELRELGFEVVE